MPIRVTCSQCRAAFAARDEFAGKRGKCPKCQAPILVPAAEHGSAVRGSEAGAAAPPRANGAARAADGEQRAPVKRPPVKPEAATKATAGNPAARSKLASPQPRAGANSKKPADRQQLARELLGSFTGDIRRVGVPLTYRIGILLTALVMIVLPILYVALIGAAAFAVYYHASHHTGLLEMGSGRARLIAISIYVGPIVAGGIMVLFMLKPLLAGSASSGRTRSLTRQAEPVLFSFVDRICQAVGSRTPARIQVDNQMNASASFDDGMLKLVRNRLVLTIGVPLAAGLNMQQFAGVLAHEFGHFTQGAGLRVTYVVRSINFWFVRVVYQRDSWDEWLEETAGDLDFRIGWVLQLARLAVYVSRGVLWLLMVVGHVVSGFMMRQMEYHADAHEARLVGASVFESTTRQLSRLDVAQQAALADLGNFVNAGKLPDDLALLVLERSQSMPRELEQALAQHVEQTKTGWFDTHPAPPARIKRAAREKDAPVFADARPASTLFADFRALSRGVTTDLYRGYFGSRFQPAQMHPTEQLLAAAMAPPPERPPLEIEI